MGDRPINGGRGDGGEAGLFPFSLRYGIVQPNGSILCTAFGFNCLTIPLTKEADAPKALRFAAPGEKSKFNDPMLTKLAEDLNNSMQVAADSKQGSVIGIRVLIVDEGLLLTWNTGNPELKDKTPEEVNQIMREGIPIMHLTTKERKDIFDV